MSSRNGARIHITGVVQGVGFRPFVYNLATRFGLAGWVRNTSAGVDIAVDGFPPELQAFASALQTQAPPLARIHSIHVQPCAPEGFQTFEILLSQPVAGAFQPISPDVAVCLECLYELSDPQDRRYRYPFINCTHCGPRFTIITDVPYDRTNTTMASFPLCPECAAEYHDPANRRFHAQPVACPVCGPQIWLESQNEKQAQGNQAIVAARNLLADGKILAIKGLGGFHLACNALDPVAVEELRRRKLRIGKPFALMAASLDTIAAHCFVDTEEQHLLESLEKPVVILRRRPDSDISSQVAPGQQTLGFMLPYTPLHALLFAPHNPSEFGAFDQKLTDNPARPEVEVLVMTSGNLSEEPIVTDNAEARQRLASLADAFLLHDRPIHIRCDDSVVRAFHNPASTSGSVLETNNDVVPIRRSRGYAPYPIQLPFSAMPLLACGAELKNTFCLSRQQYAFLSHHIGDLENYETLRSFEDGIEHFERLFRIQPEALAYDLHPDYLSTRYALDRSQRQRLPAIGVQHHHAHIAAVMAEHGMSENEQVIGVAFDGTGYGEDAAIWGGEFLIAGYRSYQRTAHLAYRLLPGGERAIREPWRAALSWLAGADIEWSPDLPPVAFAQASDDPFDRSPGVIGASTNGSIQARVEHSQRLHAIQHQLQTGLNAPPTSSVGRLFDAVSSLLGVCHIASYEAQAAIELEALCAPGESGQYLWPLPKSDSYPAVIDPSPLMQAIVADWRNGISVPRISARFHNSLAALVRDVCLRISVSEGLKVVALSGGVWQNMTLLDITIRLLKDSGLSIIFHRQVPPNDGGVALGQVAIAFHRLAS